MIRISGVHVHMTPFISGETWNAPAVAEQAQHSFERAALNTMIAFGMTHGQRKRMSTQTSSGTSKQSLPYSPKT